MVLVGKFSNSFDIEPEAKSYLDVITRLWYRL